MYNSGLVLEGGGNRAIFTSGVLDAFMENGITFPYVIGVSMGSCNAASYIAKNIHRQHDFIVNNCQDKKYMGLWSYRHTGEILNMDWVFGELCYDKFPLNYDEFENSGSVLCAVLTNAQTGKTEYFYPKDLREFGCPIIRASCSMPLVTKGVEIGGAKYFDGGISDSIPLKRAIEDGCEKIVVILTQDENFVKQPISSAKLMKRLYRKYPLLIELLVNRHNMYNEQRKFVEEEERKGNILVIRPSKPLNCTSMERDITKLETIYQLGYLQGKKSIEKVKEFLNV
ncbi:MAG: patatin family protein [Eubacterium sp.]|nr:patatin family protein [Eubacterium sp.]